jgi:hypothetical protein
MLQHVLPLKFLRFLLDVVSVLVTIVVFVAFCLLVSYPWPEMYVPMPPERHAK